MKPNNVYPAAFDNIPGSNVAGIENVAGFENTAGIENVANITKADEIDMCKLQYYNPLPIVRARLAHAYVPFQCLQCLYMPETGLKQGTIFPELDRPYGADPAFTYDG